MGAFRRLLDPLWRFIGANTWMTSAILAVATAGAFLMRQHLLAMLLGGGLGTVLMLRAESDLLAGVPAEVPHPGAPPVLPAA